MSVNQRNNAISEILTDATPNWTPVDDMSRLARVEGTLIFYYYNKSNVWVRFDHSTSVYSLGNNVVSNLSEFNALITASTTGTWLIVDDFTLDADKAIPSGVTLEFNGGVINGGAFTITGVNTIIKGAPIKLFENATFAGTWDNAEGYTEWFGAVGDGTTDDSDAFTDAVTALNKVVGVAGKTYAVKELEIVSCSFDFSQSWLKYSGVYPTDNNGKTINVTGDDNFVSVRIDCDNENCSGLWVDGNNNTFDNVIIKNNKSDVNSGTSNYGVGIIGNDNTFHNIYCYDFLTAFPTADNANGSFPRGVSFAGTANGNKITSIKTVDVLGSSLGAGSSTQVNYVENIQCIDCGDNGIYNLGGTLMVGSFFFSGPDEPIVSSGSQPRGSGIWLQPVADQTALAALTGMVSGENVIVTDHDGTGITKGYTFNGSAWLEIFESTTIIDEVVIQGTTNAILGVQNCALLAVNSLKTIPAADGSLPITIFRTRSSNVASQKVRIRNVDAQLKQLTGGGIWNATTGTVDSLHIEDVKIDITYGESDWTTLESDRDVGTFNVVAELVIRNVEYRHTDATDLITTGDFIYFEVGTVTKPSILENISFYAYESDGVTEKAITIFRGKGFAQALIKAEGFYWRTTIGPYTNGYNPFNFDTAGSAPTVGTWQEGKVLRDITPANNATSGWVCFNSGTMGTLNGGSTTGGITTGTPDLVVNDATGLLVGQYIAIVGVTGTKVITAISGLNITIDSNADATVSGAAVSWVNASWQTFGKIETI